MFHYKFDYFLEPRYRACTLSTQTTCTGPEIKPRIHSKRYVDCERICQEDHSCKFVFYIPGKHCFKYGSCDETREATNVGSIYSKDGFCPGKMFRRRIVLNQFENLH